MSQQTPPIDGAEEHAEDMGLTVRVGELEEQGRIDRELIAYLQDEVANGELGIEHLEAALGSCRRIGAAIGIVMTVMKVTEDDAFGVISKISQRQNRKLRLIADDIVLTGAF